MSPQAIQTLSEIDDLIRRSKERRAFSRPPNRKVYLGDRRDVMFLGGPEHGKIRKVRELEPVYKVMVRVLERPTYPINFDEFPRTCAEVIYYSRQRFQRRQGKLYKLVHFYTLGPVATDDRKTMYELEDFMDKACGWLPYTADPNAENFDFFSEFNEWLAYTKYLWTGETRYLYPLFQGFFP